MLEPITTCPIWGANFKAEGTYDTEAKVYEITESERAFGGYSIDAALLDAFVKGLPDTAKAKLTTWLIDQWKRGNYMPEITHFELDRARRRRSLPVHVRGDRLLYALSLASKDRHLGEFRDFGRARNQMLAWSESLNRSEVNYLVEYLEKRGWLEQDARAGRRVTVEGHTRVDEIEREEQNLTSNQCFVAMWFDDQMTDAFKNGIKPAVEEAGYEPVRIDQKEHANKIEDEIIAEIRRSRFVVADFTCGADGARGSVYYEAGFAHGLDIPVIFTCREGANEPHFDINHFNHIVWKTPEDLRERLWNRIRALIGHGPGNS